jgi:type IV pilus assembly protein PilC
MAVREFRFVGTSAVGEAIRGNVYAPSRRAATRRIEVLSEKHKFAPDSLEERHTFLYKVRHPSGKTVTGEQKAYAPEEVRLALERLGLEVIRVQKKLFTLQFRPSSTDLVMFVRLSANMLRRKLPFDEILALLITDTRSSSLKQVIRDLNSDLRGGVDPQQAFMKHQHLLGKFAAYMLGLAAASGNMADMFEATAKYLERKDEFQKQVRSALITPSITLAAAIGAFIWFVWYIIPAMAELFVDYNIKLPPLTAASLAFAHWMDSNYWWVFLLIVILTGIGIGLGRTTRGRFYIHKYMIRIPYIGDLLHKLNLEVFCRVFAVLYTGSGENQDVMRISAEATGNTFLEHQIKTITIPAMMARGTDLIVAMEASGVFLPMMIARFRSGAETGGVRESAEEMADFYENETTLKMQTAVETIKTSVAIIISILVGLLTVLSAETALIQPNATDIMFKR